MGLLESTTAGGLWRRVPARRRHHRADLRARDLRRHRGRRDPRHDLDGGAAAARAGEPAEPARRRRRAGRRVVLEHHREREAVVALLPDRLDRGGAEARLARSPHRRSACMPTALASSPSSTAPPRTTLSATISVPGRESSSAAARYSALPALSASMKTRSNGPGTVGRQRGERVAAHGRPAPRPTSARPGAHEVRAGDLGVARVELERHQATAGRQRPGEPDRAVAAERAELEDRAGALDAREELEQPALRRRDRRRRQARRRRSPRARRRAPGRARAGDRRERSTAAQRSSSARPERVTSPRAGARSRPRRRSRARSPCAG